MIGTERLILLGLKVSLPWIVKKLGGKRKTKDFVQSVTRAIGDADREFPSSSEQRKRFVMDALKGVDGLKEGQLSRIIEFAVEVQRPPYGIDSEEAKDDEPRLVLLSRIGLEALRAHGHLELASMIEKEVDFA